MPQSGHIVTNTVLDREEKAQYTFTVHVTDQSKPPVTTSARVSVHLEDVNDNPPMFQLQRYSGTVTEDDIHIKFRQPVNMVRINSIISQCTVLSIHIHS